MVQRNLFYHFFLVMITMMVLGIYPWIMPLLLLVGRLLMNPSSPQDASSNLQSIDEVIAANTPLPNVQLRNAFVPSDAQIVMIAFH